MTPPADLTTAALAYAEAKAAVDDHDGPFKGPEYAAKLSAWRGALLELEAAARRAAREVAAEGINR